MYAKLMAPPPIKFKDMDLESFLSSHKVLNGPFFLFEVRTDYVKVTDDTVLVPVTLQIRNRDITFNTKDGVARGTVSILGRVSTITDRVVQSFEDSVNVEEPAELLPRTLNNASVYWKALPLRPGRYRIDIAIKDVNNPDHVGIWAQAVTVPQVRRRPTGDLVADSGGPDGAGAVEGDRRGNFVLGNTKVRPRVTPNAAQPVNVPSRPESELLDAGV